MVVLGIFFSYEMGNRPFVSPDEGRYVEIPREMVVTGDYVTPRLNGLKYFEKPPMFYWMQSAAIKTLGINENSMRFWTVLFAILGCLSLFLVGTKCYSQNVGLVSVGVLASSLIYYCHSHLIILDLVLSVFLSGCLWSFFLAFVKENSLKIPKKFLIISMYALSALACLTKGLIGAILPGFVVFMWMLFTHNWKKLREILYVPGILVFLAIFLPWHVLAAYRNHDFLYFYFIVEHFLRYTTEFHNRYQPAWFFIPVLLIGMIPWTGFALVSLKNLVKKSCAKNSESIFLSCWILGVLGFFSFSHSKLIPYILPVIQPLALITGIFFEKANFKDFKIGAVISIFIFLAIGITYVFIANSESDIFKESGAKFLLAVIISLLIFMWIALVLAFFEKVSQKACVFALMFLSGNMLWTLNKLAPYYQDARKPSTEKIARCIRMNKSKDDLVFCYNMYYQDCPVYLNDTVGVVNFVGELEFGAKSEPEKSKLINDEKFWNLWNTTNKRVFLLLSRRNYRKVFAEKTNIHRILDFDKNFIAITNK